MLSGIYQHILDLLTFGGIRRGKENVYTIMMDKMAEALDSTDIIESKAITLHDIMVCEVSFKFSPMGGDDTKVTVELRKGGYLIGHALISIHTTKYAGHYCSEKSYSLRKTQLF